MPFICLRLLTYTKIQAPTAMNTRKGKKKRGKAAPQAEILCSHLNVS